MQWSDRRQSWCVIPADHTLIFDIVIWCADQFGPQQIDLKQDGNWSWGAGTYYGLTRSMFVIGRDYPDSRTYFSFKNADNANFFILKWGNKS